MAKIYWRSIQRGARDFADIPESMKDAVKALAMADVVAGEITAEQYKEFIGEDYPTAE
jgi:hypothetical protein